MFFRFILILSALGVCVFVISSGQEGDFLHEVERAFNYCFSCVKKMDVEVEIQGFKKR
jgi:hypothetical protein